QADGRAAMAPAREYGKVLYTGVLYRNPDPGPTFEQAVAERHRAQAGATSRAQVLDVFTVRESESAIVCRAQPPDLPPPLDRPADLLFRQPDAVCRDSLARLAARAGRPARA